MKKLILFLLALQVTTAYAEINFNYFFQTSAQYKDEDTKVIVPGEDVDALKIDDSAEAMSFQLQQLNMIVSSDIGSDLFGYVNLEMTNSTNTILDFGGIAIEDVFVRYNYNKYLKVKVGHFTPRFNSFSQTYNKFPIIPYIIRPFFYEKAWAGMVPPEDILPQKAFLQVYGFLPLGSLKLDYAAFVGNPENSFLFMNGESVTAEPGTNKSMNVTVGGRVGLRGDMFDLGVSVSHDKDQIPTLIDQGEDAEQTRFRIGADLFVEYKMFSLTGEMIYVTYDFDGDLAPWGAWDLVNTFNNTSKTPESLDKIAFFVTLNANITDKLFVYGTYNHFQDYYSDVFLNGLKGPFLGAGYSFNHKATLKFQYEHSTVDEGMITYTGNLFRLAMSVAL
jgi:hypothetical protein